MRAGVEIDQQAADPDAPGRPIRRERRHDPLDTLRKIGTISAANYDAAEALRSDIEAGMPTMGGAAQSEIHLAPWDRMAISDHQLAACTGVREAMLSIAPKDRSVLAWMIGGGTVDGFKAYACCARETAVSGLRRALDVLAGHYEQAGRF